MFSLYGWREEGFNWKLDSYLQWLGKKFNAVAKFYLTKNIRSRYNEEFSYETRKYIYFDYENVNPNE